MNFLAHFHVSPRLPDAITGAYLGDFVRGNVDQLTDLPPGLRRGIVLHRKVDAFTDTHPFWQRSARRVAPERRRLAGIVIDVVYDHFLCRHWDKFSSQPLEEFADFCYLTLISHTQYMSPEARRIVRRMREHDWLNTYRKMEGIELTFQRMSRRSTALAGIEDAIDDLHAHYAALDLDFLYYYPKLLSFARRAWSELNGRS